MTAFFQFFIKKTYTGLLTNFFSFTPFRYKIGLIRTLIDRTYKINNTSSGFQNDLIKLSDTLKRNSFPSHIIDKTFKRYLNKPSNQKAATLMMKTIHAILSFLLSAGTLE